MASLQAVDLPDFGAPERIPTIDVAEHNARLTAMAERMKDAGLQFLLVYGDREHFANICYLTGFDPRFEEAALLLDAAGVRLLLVGNECLGYLPDESLGCRVELFQEFSLLGQPRGDSRPLRTILAEFGIGAGAAVGCVGWKCFDGPNVEDPVHAIEIPGYIVDALRALTGDTGDVVNATGLLMGCEDGLRITSSADQIAAFEYAAVQSWYDHPAKMLPETKSDTMTGLVKAVIEALHGQPGRGGKR